MPKRLFIILAILSYAISQNQITFDNTNTFPLRKLSEEVIQKQVNYFYRHIIDISIGTPLQRLKVKISSSFCGLWIQNSQYFKQGFNTEQSSTFVSSKESGEFEYVMGKVVHDTVEFVFIVHDNFPFLLVDSSSIKEEYYQGIIGFGYHCDFSNPANVDLLNYLTRNSIYKISLFYFRLKTDTGGVFSVGEWPKGFADYSKYYRRTSVNRNIANGEWKVMLDSIYLEDGQFIRLKDQISIGIGGGILNVPKNVFDQIVDKYFRRLINNNECNLNSKKIYEVLCNQDVTPPHIGVLSFIVGKWNFKVDAANLFIEIPRKGQKKLWFAMVHDPKHNEFYISQFFLREIYIIYNKENHEIGFYDKTD